MEIVAFDDSSDLIGSNHVHAVLRNIQALYDILDIRKVLLKLLHVPSRRHHRDSIGPELFHRKSMKQCQYELVGLNANDERNHTQQTRRPWDELKWHFVAKLEMMKHDQLNLSIQDVLDMIGVVSGMNNERNGVCAR